MIVSDAYNALINSNEFSYNRFFLTITKKIHLGNKEA